MVVLLFLAENSFLSTIQWRERPVCCSHNALCILYDLIEEAHVSHDGESSSSTRSSSNSLRTVQHSMGATVCVLRCSRVTTCVAWWWCTGVTGLVSLPVVVHTTYMLTCHNTASSTPTRHAPPVESRESGVGEVHYRGSRRARARVHPVQSRLSRQTSSEQPRMR